MADAFASPATTRSDRVRGVPHVAAAEHGACGISYAGMARRRIVSGNLHLLGSVGRDRQLLSQPRAQRLVDAD